MKRGLHLACWIRMPWEVASRADGMLQFICVRPWSSGKFHQKDWVVSRKVSSNLLQKNSAPMNTQPLPSKMTAVGWQSLKETTKESTQNLIIIDYHRMFIYNPSRSCLHLQNDVGLLFTTSLPQRRFQVWSMLTVH